MSTDMFFTFSGRVTHRT